MALVVFALFVIWAWETVKGDSPRPSPGSREPAGGGPRVARYGMFDHLRDSYRDSWRRSTDDLIAKRDRRAAERRTTGRDQRSWWQRAQDRYADRQQERRHRREDQQRQHQTGGPTPDPQPQRPLFPDPAPKPTAEAPPAATTPPEPDAQVLRFRPRVVTDPPPPKPETPDEPTGPSDTTTTTPSTKGADMSGPTGEVGNHEQHIADLDATIRELEEGIELAGVVQNTSATLRGQVDDLQTKYGPVATATQTRADHLQAMNVDQTTTGHAAEGADALDPNAVASYHDEAENIEAGAKALQERLERALALAKAEREEAIRRYADAQETVNTDLSGDATYLGANGGGATSTTTTAPAPQQQQPEPAGATR